MTLYENSLSALAHLLNRVSAATWEAHIRSDIEAWQQRRDASQHRGNYSGHSTYDDWIIHRGNGHRVDEIQTVWANDILEKLQYVLRFLSEKPGDLRQQRKLLNGLNRHQPILREPSSSSAPSKLKEQGSGKYLRAIRCQQCGDHQSTHVSVENVIAGDVTGSCLHDAYESGTMIEMVDTLLDGSMENLEKIRNSVRHAAERAGISVVETRRKRDLCATCGSDDVNVKQWVLRGGEQLWFELAAFEQYGENDKLRAPAGDSVETEQKEISVDTAQREKESGAMRLWGVAIAALAFCALIAEFRYLNSREVPSATGSLRGNWGLLVLLAVPVVVFIGSAIQAISGLHLRECSSAFAAQSLARKAILSVAVVAAAIAVVTLATVFGAV